jgi:hypothetical protein
MKQIINSLLYDINTATNKMATITIIKNYEFCQDIFKHILSYTGYKKPMATIGKRLLSKEFQEIFNKNNRACNGRHIQSDKADATMIYRLRMLVSYEQFQFERTALAKLAMENYRDYLETLGVVNGVCIVGWFHNIAMTNWRGVMWLLRGDKTPPSVRWGRRYYDDDEEFKQNHLYDICDAGKKSSKHYIKLEQQSIKNAKRREVVSCECCSKMLTRGSLPRHMKKCSVA